MQKTICIFKAQAIGGQVIPDIEIKIRTPMPDVGNGPGWEKEWQAIIEREASLLCDALFEALPGGVLDHLLADMLKRKASKLRIQV